MKVKTSFSDVFFLLPQKYIKLNKKKRDTKLITRRFEDILIILIINLVSLFFLLSSISKSLLIKKYINQKNNKTMCRTCCLHDGMHGETLKINLRKRQED